MVSLILLKINYLELHNYIVVDLDHSIKIILVYIFT